MKLDIATIIQGLIVVWASWQLQIMTKRSDEQSEINQKVLTQLEVMQTENKMRDKRIDKLEENR